VPFQPHHVIHRGHNRQVIFAGADDYRCYLATIRASKELLGCKVYAYCLMANHVHFVIDPGGDPTSLGRLMKRVAARHTWHMNKILSRTGTLWESRFKSSPIETDSYLLACCRYIELNPVRAGVVGAPEDYQWSSCRARTGFERAEWLDEDPCYAGFGARVADRPRRYQEWLHSAIPHGEWKLIHQAVQRGQLTGDDCFAQEVQRKVGRRIAQRGPGRPRE
jgi:putative transposase